ncbi:LuxR family transcriptional regulator [Streptomyces pinistramenti]|uniref:LuxR family transcriptional regulator n=1 Tax=Streptomyces pinistramenti TaxID=2884812 RepID=UPI001D07575E|nr:LuxR family transcriptional regulator [Streptomyces pinistramenti]MCB5908814.1 LuxR family transcriptional regulator [Streptomyces pinistramenti]
MNTSTSLGQSELSDHATRVFAYAAQRSICSAEELTAIGLDSADTERAVKELVEMRLLCRAEGGAGWLTVVSPRIAAERLLRPLERGAREQYEEIERLQRVFVSLLPTYEAARAWYAEAEPIELITDLRTVQETIEDLTDGAREEVLTVQPGGARSARVLEEAASRDRRMLARGVVMRTLYQHPARYDQPTIDHVGHMMSLGAEVRTRTDGLCRMLVFDQRVAVLALRDDPEAALVVREPHMVHYTRVLFDFLWRGASPFPVTFDTATAVRISGEIQKSIVVMLSEGLEDKSIARRLGMSLRSCQRHTSEIMKAVGAKSRFQAGYELGRLHAAEQHRQ